MGRSLQLFGKKDVKRNAANRRAGGVRLSIESLEDRQMMSATPLSPLQALAADATPALTSTGGPQAATSTLFNPRYSPAELRGAYGFNNITSNGTGQTIAVVVAYHVFDETAAGAPHKTLQNDLDTFSTTFGLPKTNIILDPLSSTAATTDTATLVHWTNEAAMDIEYAHAMAPGAKIELVEAYSQDQISENSAAYTAAQIPGVSVVSMSFGQSDSSSDTLYDSDFVTPLGHTPVAFIAAAGDTSGVVTYPSASPHVLAVGGTELGASAGTGAYGLEIAWDSSGGGVSQYEAAPSFQTSFSGSTHRTTPDVAFDADPATGAKVYCSVMGGWTTGAGTSLGTPCWAGLIADADQARAAIGNPALGNVVQDIYALPASDFHDIVSGVTAGQVATTGYDKITGRGTPIANLTIAGLKYAEVPPSNVGVGVGGGIGNIPNAVAIASQPTAPTKPTNTSTAATTNVGLPAMPTVNLSAVLPAETKLHFAATDAAFETLFGVTSGTGKRETNFSFASSAATDATIEALFEFNSITGHRIW